MSQVRKIDQFERRVVFDPTAAATLIQVESEPPWDSFSTSRLILEPLARGAPVQARVPVSDRGTLGGLTQFAKS